MFRSLEGRDYFFQWDTEQYLEVMDYDITEVHFSTSLYGKALVCEVKQQGNLRLVKIPNILLQDTYDIKVFAVCDCYTRGSTVFEVKPREKPEDYIYTETEVKRYEDLEARIEELENKGDAVSSVNGKTGEVELKAADVGAVSTTGGTINGTLSIGSTTATNMYSVNIRKKVNDTQYVTGSLAMNGSNLRIQNSLSTRKTTGTGASYSTETNAINIGEDNTSVSKPILFTTTDAKADTRESLSVYSKAEVDTAITAATKVNKFELIEEITIAEEIESVVRDNLGLTALYVDIKSIDAGVTSSMNIYIVTNDSTIYHTYLSNLYESGKAKDSRTYFQLGKSGLVKLISTIQEVNETRETATATIREYCGVRDTEGINVNKVTITNPSNPFKVGTNIKIWGVKA